MLADNRSASLKPRRHSPFLPGLHRVFGEAWLSAAVFGIGPAIPNVAASRITSGSPTNFAWNRICMSQPQEPPLIRHVARTSLTILGGSLAFAAWVVLCVFALDSFSERPKFQWNRNGGSSVVSLSRKAAEAASTSASHQRSSLANTATAASMTAEPLPEPSPQRSTSIVSSHRYHGGMRYTAMGWQNPHHWKARSSQAKQISILRLNPMLWAALMWLASIASLVLEASPAEIERVIGGSADAV